MFLHFQELKLKQSPTSPSPTRIETPPTAFKSSTLPKTIVNGKPICGLSHKSSLPQTAKSSTANTDLKRFKESGIPLPAFYGSGQTKMDPSKRCNAPEPIHPQNSEQEPLFEDGQPTKRRINRNVGSCQGSYDPSKRCNAPEPIPPQNLEQEPLFKDGRPTQGRIICKKQAFYSIPATTAKPVLENGSPSRETNSETSQRHLTKSEIEPLKKTKSNKTAEWPKSNKTAKAKNSSSTPACEITDPPNVRPKRQASFLKNTYADYLDEDSDSTRDSLIEAQISKFQKLGKEKKTRKSIEKGPKDPTSVHDPPTTAKQKMSSQPIVRKEIAPQVAKKSASKGPSPKEVQAYNLALLEHEKNREMGRKFLESLDIKCSKDTPMLAVSSLEQIFSNFKKSFDCSSMMKNSGKNIFDHFLFENWSVSHLSIEIVRQIFAMQAKSPPILYTSLLQMSTFPLVQMSTLKMFPATGQLVRNGFLSNSPKSKTGNNQVYD